MKSLLSKRVVLAALLLLAALFLVRPSVGRLRGKVSQSISQALGREVEIGSLQLQFLPRPGFELNDLIIRDDPAFGAEPLVRAPEVAAALRLTALLRGRIEIASLSLSDASLNLTRNDQGRWNLEDLIDRTSRIATAPTSSGRAEPRPKFPYIEAARARVNFKSGAEKKRFALTNAELALWQESEDAWGVRLKAYPIRTDANLTDTGVLRINGLWQRAPVLDQTPVQLSFRWEQAQIGQVSTLLYGADKGWRGSAALSGLLAGTPSALRISADAQIERLGRRDVLGGDDFRITAHCSAMYSARAVSDLDCLAPLGGGTLELKGRAALISWRQLSSYRLQLAAVRIDAASALALARQAAATLPDDLTGSGTLSATLEAARADLEHAPEFSGGGSVQGLRLRSAAAGPDIVVGEVPFVVVSGTGGAGTPGKTLIAHKRPPTATSRGVSDNSPRLEIGPVNLLLGRLTPLQARATVSRVGLEASIRGDAGVKRLLQAARAVGIPAPAMTAEGASTLDLNLTHSWGSTKPAIVLGTARLRGVRAQVRGLNSPLEITDANLLLQEGSIKAQNLTVLAAGTAWRGSLDIIRPCLTPAACRFEFNLRTPELSAASLNELLNPALARKSWYRFLSLGKEQPPFLLQTEASGRISVDRLLLGKTACTHFAGELRLSAGHVSLSNFRGELLNGRVAGDWKADFASHPPMYTGAGSWEEVALGEVSRLMHDDWVDGTGSAKYEFQATGTTLEELLGSANLSAAFEITDSVFPHVVLSDGSGPLRSSSFSGTLRLREGQFSFQDAKLESGAGVYRLSGTALLDGTLDLRIASGTASRYQLSGTLFKTHVSVVPTAQASLQP
ncbi:MAG TPA: AsmA family protein [Terriglobales bacterium]|nr:AsmA family protein [Terriglobales bacterium]